MANFTGAGADDTFVGTADPDTANGNGGNDTLFGLGGNDRLDGGADNDIVNGGDNEDIVAGGAGSDTVSGANGNDYLFSDVISQGYFRPYFGNNAIFPVLDTGTAVDTLDGGDGGDELSAGYGDNVDGGAGSDGLLISFMGATAGVSADFRLLTVPGGTLTIGGGTLKNIESIIWVEGSAYGDFIADGNNSGNFAPIYGRGGNDHIIAGYYTGQLFGGDGDDILDNSVAGYGFDQYGEAGNDRLIGGSGYERLDGGEGNDRIEGNYGFDNLYGGNGDDVIDGGSFGDNLFGGGGDDILYGAGDADIIEGGDGVDSLYGDYSLISSAGGLSPASNDDTLRGGAGNDRLQGDQGNDILDGGADDDLLYGGLGNDSMTGGSGVDRMEGGEGNDTGYGGDGNDLILAGTGTDQLSGEGDNDRLYFGADFDGSDLAAGGAGIDQLLLQGNYAALTLTAANIVAVEYIRLLSAADSSIVTAPGGTFSYNLTAADSLVSGTDLLRVEANLLGVGEILTFDGSAETSGRFAVVGGAGSDLIRTGAGDDILNGGGGADTLRGGLGNDEYIVDNIGDVVEENAGEGTDKVNTTLAAYSLFGTQIEDLLANNDVSHDFRGSIGDNIIIGGMGSDFIRLQDGGNDTAVGHAGNDVFLLGATLTALDSVIGGDGIDQIALQGDYAGAEALVLGANVISIENLAILAGSDTRFGDPGTNFYDYEITVLNEAVAAGIQLVVDANRLRPGEDLTFDGSAETDGSFFIYGGGGNDHLTGGAKNDVFIFGGQGQWGLGDVLIGGAGIDQLGLRGNYTIIFGAGQLIGVEQIGMVSAQDTRYGPLGSSYSYDLTMVDANVDSFQMTVDAAPLRPGETLTFNGSAEDDGSFRVFGGRGDDTITGSQNGDILVGNAGADVLTGGGGGDSFRYVATTDSTTGAVDRILDFTPGTDSIDLSRIDADTNIDGNQAFRWIGNSAFTGSFAASAGELRAYQSGNSWFVEGDTDGNGAADFVIMLTLQGPTPLSAGDFLL